MLRSLRIPRIDGQGALAPRFGGTGREPATVHRRHPLHGVMVVLPVAVRVRAGRRQDGKVGGEALARCCVAVQSSPSRTSARDTKSDGMLPG